ncbi:MAG: 6-bladed beta-propeller [Rhodocyclaceae bacterium]
MSSPRALRVFAPFASRAFWAAGLALALYGCGAPAPAPQAEDAAPVVWPKPPDAPRIRALRPVSGPKDWGITRSFFGRIADMLSGRGEERFVRPAAVAERGGVLYVADPGARSLWILDGPRGRHARIVQVGAEALVSPVALALRADGSFFLADTGLKKVFLLDAEGIPIRTISVQGLERPAGLAWDEAARRLYVVDSIRHRVSVFDANGALLRHLGGSGSGEGQFNHPTHLALDPAGALVVTDALNFRIQRIAPDGRYLGQFGQVGDGAGDFAAPKGVALDSAGHIHVVDARFDAVQVFERDGSLLMAYGERGSGRGQLSLPTGISISAEGRIYVADGYNHRVQIYAGVPAAEGAK